MTSEQRALHGRLLAALRKQPDLPSREADATAALAHVGTSDEELLSLVAAGHASRAMALREAGRLSEALEACLEAERNAGLGADPVTRIRVLFVSAQVLFGTGHHRAAVAAFEEVLDAGGLDGDDELLARNGRASTFRAMGDLERAGEAFEELVATGLPRAHPARQTLVLLNAASCWDQLGRFEEGDEALRRATQLVPASRPDLEQWVAALTGWALRHRARHAEAVRFLDELLDREDLAPEVEGSAMLALCEAAEACGEGERRLAIERATPFAERCEQLWLRGRAVDLHLALSRLHEAREAFDAAVHHLRAAERLRAEVLGEESRLQLERHGLQFETLRLRARNAALRAEVEDERRDRARLEQALRDEKLRTRRLGHDLRNVLTLVGVSTQLLSASTLERDRRTLERAATRMADMVASVMGSDDHGATVVDLSALLDEQLPPFQTLAEPRGITLRWQAEGRAPVELVRQDLDRVLDNLLSNALKFTPAGGGVRVSVTTGPRVVRLQVDNDGPGFAELDTTDALVLGARRGAASGWGIGLNTVHQLVTAMGGALSLRNPPTGGAEVVLTLPAAADPPSPSLEA